MRHLLLILVLLTNSTHILFAEDELIFQGVHLQAEREPIGVSTGDFNGDGTMDFAAINDRDDSVSVFIGNGCGTFQTAVNYPLEFEPRTMVTADINSDGLLDFVIGNDFTQFGITILVNQGSGKFSLENLLASEVDCLICLDFNGDGFVDLASTAFGQSEIQLIANNGDGTFSQQSFIVNKNYGLGKIIKGDFNNDQIPDLAVANSNDSISILLGLGSGEYSKPSDTPKFNSVTSFSCGDFNKDGNLDLVAATGFVMTIFFGIGDGTFMEGENFNSDINWIRYIAVVDFDSDGRDDVFVSKSEASYILFNEGVGKPFSRFRFQLGGVMLGAVFGDFNNDSRLDIGTAIRRVSDGLQGRCNILFGTGNRSLGLRSSFGDTEVLVLKEGDFNRDGILDVVTTSNSSSISVWIGAPDGSFVSETTYPANSPYGVTVADFNIDGNQDVATTSRETDSVSIRLGSASGLLSPPISFPVGVLPTDIAHGDFNNDGYDDLVCTNRFSSDISILTNVGDGNFVDGGSYSMSGTPVSVIVEDFNLDGNQDFAVGRSSAFEGLFIFLGAGDGTFEKSIVPVPTATGISSGDFNKDQIPDLAIVNALGVTVLFGIGDGNFVVDAEYDAGVLPSAVSSGDLDRDGNVDLAITNEDSDSVTILLGEDDGSFANKSDYLTGSTPRSLIIQDLNMDGLKDVAVGNSSSGQFGVHPTGISVLINQGELELLVGDINLDGVVDLLDIVPFVELVIASKFQIEADVNSDGVVDVLDVAPFVELLTGG